MDWHAVCFHNTHNMLYTRRPAPVRQLFSPKTYVITYVCVCTIMMVVFFVKEFDLPLIISLELSCRPLTGRMPSTQVAVGGATGCLRGKYFQIIPANSQANSRASSPVFTMIMTGRVYLPTMCRLRRGF